MPELLLSRIGPSFSMSFRSCSKVSSSSLGPFVAGTGRDTSVMVIEIYGRPENIMGRKLGIISIYIP
jgi:hypothetical protein